MLIKKLQASGPLVWLVLIQWIIAFEWLKSGWGKFAKADFMNGIEKTLQTFSGPKNPNDWYTDFVQSNVLPNATLFGNITRFGEILAGIALLVGGFWLLTRREMRKVVAVIVLIALIGGALLNFNFYFAAGWTSPSTEGINIVMGLTQTVLAVYYAMWLKRH